MPTLFSVHGPLVVPCYAANAGRSITRDNVREFWTQNDAIRSQRGCYVFGMRAGRGFTPAYVGKATRTFGGEVFAPHKLAYYHQVLAEYKRGTPVLFLVTAPKKRGIPNNSHVGELEAFLIQTALAANPHIMNVKGTKAEDWGIVGILRSGRGKASLAAKNFRRMMKL